MENLSFSTLCVHAGTRIDPITEGVNTPIYTSTSYPYLDTDERPYPRYFNLPNQKSVIEKLIFLEGCDPDTSDGILFSSGMAAISTTLLGLLASGDHVLFQRGLYGGTTNFISGWLKKYGIEWSYPASNDPEAFEEAIRPTTRMVYIETPSNPLLGITDMESIARIAKRYRLISVIDSTFASPVNQNPRSLGIDIVIHSATKYLGGHSDICAGAIIAPKEVIKPIYRMALNLGGSLNPETCYLLERSMKTLAIRVEKQNQNTMEVALFLAQHPAVSRVFYHGLPSHPCHAIAKKQMRGFGGMLSFELRSADPVKFQKSLKLIRPSMSLGGVDSIICSPVMTSHRHLSREELDKEGITDKVLRLSVGIEDATDIIHDLKQALENSTK
ncbi:MAG: PLP-dependent transferase [Bacteroidales bacterium]|nr:PLP-dependent transferase [Bacteroidales bacterium]